jgi:multicomponent Na+:H+ antiporter subunit D
MSFAEHHLKRVLAFSTISHSGVLLFAVGLGSRMAIAGWLIYICAHAMIKSGLFFTAGILLHRLRTMSEPLLFRRGRKLKFTAGLWLLGAFGLAGLPPFATALAEDMVTHSSGGNASFMIMIPFLISGILTAGAVLRIFMRVFCGWGDKGPSDRSSQVDELPETLEENCVIPFRLFIPAFICIASGIALTFLPSLQRLSLGASSRFLSQFGFIETIYSIPYKAEGSTASASGDFRTMIVHGAVCLICAFALAAWTVFHRKIWRQLRWPSHLEGRMSWARQLQSGQVADYVTWTTVGVAVLGGIFFVVR